MQVIVADDHPLFRSAMCQALSGALNTDVIETESFEQTLQNLANCAEVELVFLDLNMPGNEGLLGLSRLRNLYPDVLVVIVSAEENLATINKCISLGACGYIPKSTPLPVMLEAIAQIREGEQWLPTHMLDKTLEQQPTPEQLFMAKLELLTPHQFKVLVMIADGLLNKQIAYEMGISESTTKQHVSAILHKLEVSNRTLAGIMFKQAIEHSPEQLNTSES